MKTPPEKSPAPRDPRRRPYRPPELVEYGSIAAKTLSNTTGSFPDAMLMMTMVCY